MNNFATMKDFEKLPLAQLETTLETYLKIAKDSDYNITKEFENELRALTALAKLKGSVKKW
jgi:hypothetical protein